MNQSKKAVKRPDGRKIDEIRKVSCKVGVVKNADGSAEFIIGNTTAIAAVYGPRELYPKFKQDPSRALLRCKYNLMSFSVSDRKRPAPSRRDIELGLVIKNALSQLIFLEKYPKLAIDVFIEISQADAGTRCAGICAASLALADAGIQMRELAGSIAAGALGDLVVLDLTKEEEDYSEGATDLPITYLPKQGLITSLQLDGDISFAGFKKALKMGINKCKELVKMQEEALKINYLKGDKK